MATAPIEWKNHKINVLDTPGYFDFAGDAIASVRVADSALLVVCASSGLEVGTEKSWEYVSQAELPSMIFINKMERENANFTRVVEQLRDHIGNQCVPIQIPIGSADTFKGYVDIIKQKAYVVESGKVTETDIPADLVDEVAQAREKLIEAVAVADDELMMKYLEGEELSNKEIETALSLGTKSKEVIPILCGSATANIGVDGLLDYLVFCMPSAKDVSVKVKNQRQMKKLKSTVITKISRLSLQDYG